MTHPDDLPPIWSEEIGAGSGPVNLALALLIAWITLILVAVSPALVIAVWRWAF